MSDFSKKALSYLIQEQDGQTVAHCLDLDLLATGESESSAVAGLNVLVREVIRYSVMNGFDDLLQTKAPAAFWEKFERATARASSSILEIDPPAQGIRVAQRQARKRLAEGKLDKVAAAIGSKIPKELEYLCKMYVPGRTLAGARRHG
jgi:hypothetical protein